MQGSGVPGWVFILLLVLVALGGRRLRSREVPMAVALIAPTAFLSWSIVGAAAFAQSAGVGAALLVWCGGAAVGAVTTALVAEPRGQRRPGGRLYLPGSRLPLVLYLGVFIVRFACGAWAAMVPAQAALATGVGLGVGAAMTARLVIGVLGWRPVPPGSPNSV